MLRLIALVFCLLLVGCAERLVQPPQESPTATDLPTKPATEEPTAESPQSPPAAARSPIAVPQEGFSIPALRQKMPYAKARELLLAKGWQADFVNPMYRRYVSPLAQLMIDKGYNEVEDCSGTGLGLCKFRFSGPNGEHLVVVTQNNAREPILFSWGVDAGGEGED